MSLPNGNYVLAAPRSFIYADIASRNPVDDGPFQGRKIGQHLFQVQSYPTTPTTYTIMHIESGQYVASDPVSKQVVLASKGSLASNLKWNFTSLPGCVDSEPRRFLSLVWVE